MITLLAVMATLLMILPAITYDYGFKTAKNYYTKPKAIEYQCSHVWGTWQGFSIQVVDNYGTKLYKQDAQKRSCEICGYEEREQLRAFK